MEGNPSLKAQGAQWSRQARGKEGRDGEMRERHPETGTKAAICPLSQSTHLHFMANTGAACSLKVETGVGEAETSRVYKETDIKGKGRYSEHYTKYYVLILVREKGTRWCETVEN